MFFYFFKAVALFEISFFNFRCITWIISFMNSMIMVPELLYLHDNLEQHTQKVTQTSQYNKQTQRSHKVPKHDKFLKAIIVNFLTIFVVMVFLYVVGCLVFFILVELPFAVPSLDFFEKSCDVDLFKTLIKSIRLNNTHKEFNISAQTKLMKRYEKKKIFFEPLQIVIPSRKFCLNNVFTFLVVICQEKPTYHINQENTFDEIYGSYVVFIVSISESSKMCVKEAAVDAHDYHE